MAFGRSSPPPPAEAPAQEAAAPTGPGLTPDDLVSAVNGIAKRIFTHTDGPWERVDPQWIYVQLAHAAELLRFMPMRPANANQAAPLPKGKAN